MPSVLNTQLDRPDWAGHPEGSRWVIPKPESSGASVYPMPKELLVDGIGSPPMPEEGSSVVDDPDGDETR